MKEKECEQIKKRMIQVVENHNATLNQLGGRDASLARKINYQLQPNNTLTLDVVLIFAEKFREISLDWIMTGEGNMYKKDSVLTGKQMNVVIAIKSLIQSIDELD